mmetsp:Transcript_5418/g.17435  ORF Transcript_5418/g.17435 Transcript_5418/m.17435 type:complete len:212 (+) Transcript_5418:118-753(+)
MTCTNCGAPSISHAVKRHITHGCTTTRQMTPGLPTAAPCMLDTRHPAGALTAARARQRRSVAEPRACPYLRELTTRQRGRQMRRTTKPHTWRAYDHERPHSKSASSSASQAFDSHSANGTTESTAAAATRAAVRQGLGRLEQEPWQASTKATNTSRTVKIDAASAPAIQDLSVAELPTAPPEHLSSPPQVSPSAQSSSSSQERASHAMLRA